MLAIATTTLLSGRYAVDDGHLLLTAGVGGQTIAEDAQAGRQARPQPQQYGYHNTFHLHATPAMIPPQPPPVYQPAVLISRPSQANRDEVLPRYTCTVSIRGQLGVKCELASPFMEAPPHSSNWHDIYAEVNGTQLRIYKLKVSSTRLGGSSNKQARPGKLVKAYSLQHAEVGIAADFKKGEPVPKSTLGRLIPPSARQKIFETDPHLFEPLREHVVRLRLESEQFLLCASSQAELLDWVESLAAAIDIAMPLEDRSEPRYRSLPRRVRRQREIETGASAAGDLGNLEDRTSLVRQQERIFRDLYPHLASDHDVQRDREAAAARAVESMPNSRPPSRAVGNEDADPDADDLDRTDALVPTITLNGQATPQPVQTPSLEAVGDSYFDITPRRRASLDADTEEQRLALAQLPGLTPVQSHTPSTDDAAVNSNPYDKPRRRATPQLTPASALRYRRRCAPVLLATSPRASPIIVTPILTAGSKSADQRVSVMMRRVKIDASKQRLVPFEKPSPRYDAHDFGTPQPAADTATAIASASPVRPSLGRGDTASTAISRVSTATTASIDTTESLQASRSTLSTLSTAETTLSITHHPSASASHESISQAQPPSPTLETTPSEATTPAPNSLAMTREISKGSLADSTAPPSPTTSSEDAVVVKRSRRLGLHSMFPGRKGDAREKDKRAARVHVKPVIPAGQATEAQMAAYAALMF